MHCVPCSDQDFGALVRRFTDDRGAAYSLGRSVTILSSFLTDSSRFDELEAFAKKWDGKMLDATDFLDEVRAHFEANQRFLRSTAREICDWVHPK